MKSYVDGQDTVFNTSVVNWADSKFVVNSGGDSLSGQYDFNGGWTDNGLSIINGDIYAQTGYFYNLTGLDITTLKMNGSFLPSDGYDDTFDIGSTSLRWKDLYLGGEVFSNGTGDSYFMGNVGIGTTIPGVPLEVNGDIGIGRVAGGYTFRESVGGGERAGIISNAVNDLIFNTGAAAEKMRITSGGNVGIGTTTPNAKLEVTGDVIIDLTD